MDAKLKIDLDRIIDEKQIRTVFQAIVSLRDGTVVGHEALSRITCETGIANVDQLFAIAGESDRLWDLEQLCRTTALRSAFHGGADENARKLFLNVNPNIMHDEKFRHGFTKEYLKQYGILPDNIIFEITERNAVEDISGFRGTIDHYKEQNYHIAVDDAGAGFSGLNLISDVHPHYVKLDMQLIRDIDRDSMKYALVKSMVELSRMANIQLIAEGVETGDELATLINLGVQYAQGYFIQRPQSEILVPVPEVLSRIIELNRRRNHVYGNQVGNIYIENICTPTETITPQAKVDEVFSKLKGDPFAFGFCVVENDTVVGVVTKAHLVLQLSGLYGYSLNQHRKISALMDSNFMAVDGQTPINVVSNAAMSRQPDKLYDFIVVTKGGKYLGTVTIKDLLQKTTEIEVINAKGQNPLTGLPGNIAIERKMQQMIQSDQAYSAVYFDIDNFKAYNDVYGFENGDKIICLLADILVANLPQNQFVGHVGGDDFVVIQQGNDPQTYCRRVMDIFQSMVMKFYSQEDADRGFILAENRRGEMEQFPVVSISAAGVIDAGNTFSSVEGLTETLAKLKKKSKLTKGNSSCWQTVGTTV